MLVSAVRLPPNTAPGEAPACAEALVARAAASGADLLVFPAGTGEAYDGGEPGAFFRALRAISRKYPDIGICPGVSREAAGGRVYNRSELLAGGEALLCQRQIYLSRTEREAGLSRGDRLEYADFRGFKTCIVMGADAFYPQVSRLAALEGAELALFPVAYPKRMGRPKQAAGAWREAQMNLFFAVESCFSGTLGGVEAGGWQAVMAPLSLDVDGRGFLARSDGDEASAALHREWRCVGVSRFDVLAQLNPALYGNMELFRGDA